MDLQDLFHYLAGAQCAPFRHFFLTLCGSTALYLFSLSRGFRGSSPVLKRLMPGHRDAYYDRIDFVVVIFFGSIIGTVFFLPANATQALAAGFGWVSAINVLVGTDQKPVNESGLRDALGGAN